MKRTNRANNQEADSMADDLIVTRDGDTLVIRLQIKAPTPSATGKTLVVASTRGNQKTSLKIEGKDLYLGVNAYVYAEPKGIK
jgi:SOS-response transcriptional repressor LexA